MIIWRGVLASLFFQEDIMNKIFHYLDKKTKFYTVIGALANGGLALAQPLVVSRALSLNQGELTYFKIVQFAIFGFTVYFVLYSLMLFCNHTHNVFRREIQMNMRADLFGKLMTNKDYSEDEKITMLTQDMEYLGDNYLEKYINIICWGFVALLTAIYIITQNLLLGSIFVFFTILRPIPQYLMNKRLKHTGDDMAQGRVEVHNQVSDSIRGAQTLLMNQAILENRQKLWNVNWKYQRAIQKFCFTHNIVFFCNGFMVFLSQVLPLVLGFFFAMNGHRVSVASLVAMYIAAGQLVSPIQTIMYDTVDIQGAKTTADKIYGVLDSKDDKQLAKDDMQELRALHIQNLSKSYGSRQLFTHLNLDIQTGQKVLIKGPSGCGKSTLFRIIIGEEQADEGQITGVTTTNKYTSHFVSSVGIISQHPFLFNDTVRYNLTLGQVFSDEDLWSVLKQVKLDNELTEGLDFVVSNNGDNISGGQRVRIELARFLLRKKAVLLADEVTAALDEKNSQMVRELLFSLPVMMLEIAHHIDDESRYNQIIDLGKY